MPYLVGTFERSSFFSDEDLMHDTAIVLQLTKEHLISAKKDHRYQVVNLTTQEFYDPEKNKWRKFKVK